MHHTAMDNSKKNVFVAVPARGVDCISYIVSGLDGMSQLPSPRGVWIASKLITECAEAMHGLPSPRGVWIASAKGYKSV